MLIYPKIQIGLASPETKQATCEQASPHVSYRSRRSAPEGCPGGREGGREGREEEEDDEEEEEEEERSFFDSFGLSRESK